MKVLFDQNISHRLINRIKDIFPEAHQVRDLGIEGYSDQEIWKFAKKNGYTIITFDGDFYDFSLVWGHPPKIVWLRSWNQTTNNVESILRQQCGNISDFIFDNELACLEILNN